VEEITQRVIILPLTPSPPHLSLSSALELVENFGRAGLAPIPQSLKVKSCQKYLSVLNYTGTSRYTIRYGVRVPPEKAVGCFGSFKTPCEYIPSLGKYGGAHRNLSLRIDLQGSGMLCKPKTGRFIICSGRQDQLKNPLLSRRLGGGNVKIVMLVSTLQLGGCYS
jgi:hypothetical protein